MAAVNPDRDNRKHKLERELHKIRIEELGESALEYDSFYRGLVEVAPSTDNFWRGLPRYMLDVLRKPSVMPESEVEGLIVASIENAREIYRKNPERYK